MSFTQENTISPEQIRRSTLFAFMMETIVTPYIHPEDAPDDTLLEIMANPESRWATGIQVSDADRDNIAAMHVLCGVRLCIEERRLLQITEPSLLRGREVIAETAASHFKSLGMDFGVKFDGRVFRDTFRVCRGTHPAETSAAQIVQEVWNRRGTVTEEYFDEVEQYLAFAAQDETGDNGEIKSIQVGEKGEVILGYAFPETPVTALEIPFYRQYISDTHGGKQYLDAFTADTTEINERIRALEA